jgi:hypothetical protein
MRFGSPVLFLVALLVAGCQPRQPPTPIPPQARPRLQLHKLFRLGAFDFGRGPDEKNNLGQALPAMLLGELQETGRFSIHEGGNIRQHEALNEGTAKDLVDGYLSGTITSESASQVCFDVRLANAVNHQVLFTRTTCIGYQAGDRLMVPQREPLKRLAEDIARAIKQVGYAPVLSADGDLVFVEKGASVGVVPGMVAYLVSTGDTIHDKAVHVAVKEFTGVDPAYSLTVSTPVVIGEIYILSVEDKYCVGVRYRGSYVLPGDTAFFK